MISPRPTPVPRARNAAFSQPRAQPCQASPSTARLTSFSIATSWPKCSASIRVTLISDKSADVGNEGECAGGGIDDSGRSHDDALDARGVQAIFEREPVGEASNLPQDMPPAARVGRLRGFRDNLPQEIGDRRDDFGSPDIDPERIGSIPGDLVIDGVTTNPPGGDADRPHPTGPLEFGDHQGHGLLGKPGGPRQIRARDRRIVQ